MQNHPFDESFVFSLGGIMKAVRYLGLIIACIATSSCSQMPGIYVANTAVTDDATISSRGEENIEGIIDGSESPGPINLSHYMFPGTQFDTVSACLEQKAKDQSGADAAKKEAANLECKTAYQMALLSDKNRNRLVEVLIQRSNEICKVHKAAILSNSATIGFSGDLIATSLSALSAAFTPVDTKTALSTAAAIVGAANSGADANFYQNLYATAILKQIDRSREDYLSRVIVPGLSKDMSTFSIDAATRHIAEYHARCSFFYGVMTLADDERDTQIRRTRQEVIAEIETLQKLSDELTTKIGTAGDQSDKDALRLQRSVLNSELVDLFSELRTATGAATKTVVQDEDQNEKDAKENSVSNDKSGIEESSLEDPKDEPEPQS